MSDMISAVSPGHLDASSFRRWLVGVVLLAALSHGLYAALAPAAPLTADAATFDAHARELLDVGSYSADGGPDTAFMPGYPVLVASVYALVRDPRAVRFLQALVLLPCAVLLVGGLGRRVGGERVGVGAAAALALLPALVIYPTTLNAETLVILLVAALALWLARGPRSDAPAHTTTRRLLAWAAIAGLLVGLLAICKPETVLWLVAIPLAATVHGVARRRLPLLVGVSVACFALVMSPWWARNLRATGRFVPFSTRAGQPFWLSTHQPPLTEYAEPAFLDELAKCRVPGDPVATDACFMRDARRQALAHPAQFVVGVARRGVATLIASHTDYVPGLDRSFGQARAEHRWLVVAAKALLLLAQALFVVAGLGGLALLVVRRHPLRWVLGYLTLSKIAVHAVMFGTGRYGLHVAPLLAIGCGVLVAGVLARRRAATQQAAAARA